METTWYIHQLPDKTCRISPEATWVDGNQTWGPFASEDEALARRVGLIRAGKCQPVPPPSS